MITFMHDCEEFIHSLTLVATLTDDTTSNNVDNKNEKRHNK
jgi:hypothetical protein